MLNPDGRLVSGTFLSFHFHCTFNSQNLTYLPPFSNPHPAFVAFQEVYGHLKIPQDFVIPRLDPWPVDSYDVQLGKVLQAIYDHGVWEVLLMHVNS